MCWGHRNWLLNYAGRNYYDVTCRENNDWSKPRNHSDPHGWPTCVTSQFPGWIHHMEIIYYLNLHNIFQCTFSWHAV